FKSCLMHPNHSNSSKPGVLFEFNSLLDVETLNNLYAGDYGQAEVVFQTFFEEAKDYPAIMQQYYQAKELVSLKQFVHKIAHPFNYVGLSDLAECLQDFEKTCKHVDEISDLHRDLHIIVQSIRACLPIVDEES